MKTYIIGDVHGCSGALRLLLAKLSPDPEEDRLILLGDLFDRGPDAWDVFQYVRTLADTYGDRFILLRGNHEDYLLRDRMSFTDRMVWERVGRKATVRSFKKHGEKMEDAAPWIREHVSDFFREEGGAGKESDAGKEGDAGEEGTSCGSRFQCVHAALIKDPIEANAPYTLFHDHDAVRRNRYDGPLTIVGHIALEKPVWFAGDGKTVRRLKENMWHDLPEKGIICIDAGCGKGGRLVGMVIRDGQFMLHSVPEEG